MPRTLLSLLLALGVVASGCGSSGGDPDADPSAIVPARAPIYVEADLAPGGDRGDAIKALSQKLAGTDEPGAEVRRLIEKEARKTDRGFSFSEDVDPWLGERIAVFISDISISGTEPDADYAVVAPTEDADKAREALERDLGTRDEGDPAPKVVTRTYRDVEYKVETVEDTGVALVDDFAVLGSDRAIKAAIDTREGSSLADADAYQQARSEVAEEAVGFAYVRVSQLLSSLGPQGAALRPVLGSYGETFMAALDVEEDAIRIETAQLGVKEPPSGGPGALLAALPGDAWVAAGTADVGAQFERQLKQLGRLGALGGMDAEDLLGQLEKQIGLDIERDLIAWMGDAAIFVRGKALAELGGALVVRSKDPEATARAIPKLARLARTSLPGVRVKPLDRGGAEGVTLTSSEIPLPVHMAVAGDRFLVAVTDDALDAALKPAAPLSAGRTFRTAGAELGDGLRPSFFLDMGPVRALLDETGAVQGEDAKQARRALEAITAMASGSRRDGKVQRGAFVVGVK